MPVRVLIADDSVAARKTLQELLCREGYDVCGEAENGLEAVTRTVDLRPDVVILDLAMPEADGLSAANRILQVLPETPIVLYTLHALPQLELEGKKHAFSVSYPKLKHRTCFRFSPGCEMGSQGQLTRECRSRRLRKKPGKTPQICRDLPAN